MSEQYLGRVVSVSPAQLVLMLDGDADENEAISLEMGSLIKIIAGGRAVFGLTSGMTIPMPETDASAKELRIAEVELVGEILEQGAGYQRGVSRAPGLGDKAYMATEADLQVVYAAPHTNTFKFGTLHQDRNVDAYAKTDDLLGKHFAVLGTTGCGKSCAVANLLHSILDQHPNGHIVLLDIHNEYAAAFGDRAEVFSAERIQLPYWLLNFEEIQEIMIGSESQWKDTMAEILGNLILTAKKSFSERKVLQFVTQDTPIPYRLSDLTRLIDETMGKLDKPIELTPYMRLRSRIKQLQSDPRYGFMFPGLSVSDNLTQILGQLFRVPVNGKPVTIVDLSGVPSEIVNVVVSVLCRMTFDFAIHSERKAPVLLVCEEAHRYTPADDSLGFGPTKRALAKIAKEGRKYGASLCVVSQRPSELDMSVLSQCSTIFAMRMTNQSDRDFVRAAMAESGMGLLNFLPALRNQEAIALGEGVPVPMRVIFSDLTEEQRPKSATAEFSEAWSEEELSPDLLDDIVRRWRRDPKGKDS